MTTGPVPFCHWKAALLTREHPGGGRDNQLAGYMAPPWECHIQNDWLVT